MDAWRPWHAELLERGSVQIDGGWRIRTTERFHIDVLRMNFNWRIVTTYRHSDWEYDRGWCYQEPLMVVVLRCGTFDPDRGEEPIGWVKEVRTERRGCAAYRLSKIRAHRGYDPHCPDCGNEKLA